MLKIKFKHKYSGKYMNKSFESHDDYCVWYWSIQGIDWVVIELLEGSESY